MDMIAKFLVAGTQVSAEAVASDEIYLGIGGIVHPRVFQGDQHTATVAEKLWEMRHEVLDLIPSGRPLKVCVPQNPNWNTCWATVLLCFLLQPDDLDAVRVEYLNKFGALVRKGLNPCLGPIERSVLAVFDALMDDAELTACSQDDRDKKKLKDGCDFLRFCYQNMGDYASLQYGRFLRSGGAYQGELAKVSEDHRRYLHDLQRAYQFTAVVEHRSGASHRVRGLYLSAPASRLFKFWSRSSRDGASTGFALLWVQWAENRWIISVDPSQGYTLGGLGDHLTALEAPKNPTVSAGDPRPGYAVANPWYDGRGDAMSGTLVDSPSGGTRLSPSVVRKSLKRVFKVRNWCRADSGPHDGTRKYLIYISGLVTVIAIAGIASIVVTSPESACKPEAIALQDDPRGEQKIALVVGVSDYRNNEIWRDLIAPENDAKDIWKRLTNEYGFTTEKSRILLSNNDKDPSVKRATLENIEPRFIAQIC